MEQLVTITRHSDYLNLFTIVSVRETVQHFDCLVTPARYKAQTCYHQDSDGLSPLCNTRSRTPCFPDEGPWAQLGSPLTNSALKGIGLISHQPVRPARWQDQCRENYKTKRLSIEIFGSARSSRSGNMCLSVSSATSCLEHSILHLSHLSMSQVFSALLVYFDRWSL